MNEKTIRLALSIISGRKNAENISNTEQELLGFSYYANTSKDEVLLRCEEILLELWKSISVMAMDE